MRIASGKARDYDARMQSWQVSRVEHGCTLLEFLAERLRISRRQAKAMLDARSVFVNRRRVWMARHALRQGDLVEVQTPSMPAAKPPAVRLLHQDDHFLIVDKPAGMLVDGPRGVEAELRKLLHSDDIRLVHRLDKDTSGCLMLARNRAAFDAMVPLFEHHRVIKVYDVIVAGRFPKGVRTIQKDVDGRAAVTHVLLLSAGEHASHLRVRIETGRTHQIRKHMLALRHPVVGDRQYAAGPVQDDALRIVPRQMLHASQLAFIHPITGASVRVKAPMPPDFARQLRKLGLSR